MRLHWISSSRFNPPLVFLNLLRQCSQFQSQGSQLSKGESRVFISVAANGESLGSIIIKLFADDVPKTAENFKSLCTGSYGYGYKGSLFHRIIPGFMCQGGDITNHNGTGGKSIYGEKFADENFIFKHDQAGLLSMANCGPDTNASQFFITLAATPWLDGKHVVFGTVEDGFNVVKQIEALGSQNGVPTKHVVITECGEMKDQETES